MKGRKNGAGSPSRRKSFFRNEKEALAIQKALQSPHGLTKEQALALMDAEKPTCCIPGRKDLMKSSPTCLCGLIPAEGHHRKKGLWAKYENNRNPATSRKRKAGEPAGIPNLGNTCYMASALQLLHSVPEVKEAILTIEPKGGTQEDQAVALATKELFGELEYSPYCAAEAKDLAEALRLPLHIQQDPQEFMKLFQSLLEKSFGDPDQSEPGIIEKQFAGGASYATKCQKCAGFSESSFHVHPFLDLQLQVGDQDTLKGILDEYFAPCHLNGSNKYKCDNCGIPTDAERCVLIRNLPPRLQITLSRFDYDIETGCKRKICKSLKIPMELDLAHWLNRSSEVLLVQDEFNAPSKYTLTCILHHMGDSADSGHYVAQVRLANGKWWIANDDILTLMGDVPVGDLNHGCDNANTDNPESKQNFIESKSAYICIYTRDAEWLLQTQMEAGNGNGSLSQAQKEIKERIIKKVEDSLAAWNKTVASIDERRLFVRKCINECQVEATSQVDQWVDADWLESCMDDESEPTSFDTSAIICPHQKLDPKKVSGAKQISEKGFEMLKTRYNQARVLTSKDLCRECLLPMCEEYLEAVRESATRASILDALKEPMGEDQTGFWVSRSWLQSWKKRPGPNMTRSPTAALVCCHNELAPHRLANRAKVPEAAWNFFKESYLKRNECPAEAGELGEFSTTECHDCSQCSIEASEEEDRQQAMRQLIRAIQADLPRLTSGAKLDLEPGITYYLWPTKWMMSWRKWLQSKGRDGGKTTPTTTDASTSMVCTCHPGEPGATFSTPRICVDRGKFQLDPVDAEEWEVLTESEFLALMAHHNGGEQDINRAVRCWISMPEDEQQKKKSKLNAGGSEAKEATLSTSPPPCQEHIQAHSPVPIPFYDENFEVVLSSEEEAIRPAANERSARRRLGRQRVSLSCTDTVRTLKLKIFELLTVAPPNQRVFWDSVERSNNSETLGNLGLRVGTTISVVNAHLIDDTDMSWLDEEMREQTTGDGNGNKKEAGFANTVLLGRFL